MPAVSKEVYDALTEAGASEDKATRAAEVVTPHTELATDVAVIRA